MLQAGTMNKLTHTYISVFLQLEKWRWQHLSAYIITAIMWLRQEGHTICETHAEGCHAEWLGLCRCTPATLPQEQYKISVLLINSVNKQSLCSVHLYCPLAAAKRIIYSIKLQRMHLDILRTPYQSINNWNILPYAIHAAKILSYFQFMK
jgi:hypothetical protein